MLQQAAVRAEHQRQIFGAHAEAFDHGAAVGVILRIEHRVGIAVAAEKDFQSRDVGHAGTADQRAADPAPFEQPHTAQDESAHDDLADFGGADHEGPHMRRIERHRPAALRTCLSRGQRFASRELAHLAGELTRMMNCDRGLAVETVTARDLDGAFEHQPGGRMVLADVKDDFAGGEVLRRAAREPFRRLDLGRIEHGEELVTAVVRLGHGKPPR
jgi:hypothetical protein